MTDETEALLKAVEEGGAEAAEEIVRRIEAVYETARVLEDKLHQAALRAIARNAARSPGALAAIALRTLGIKFCRWYV